MTATTLTLDPQDRLTEQFAPTGTMLRAGLTSGEYQLQVRLKQVDEYPGSTIRYADIRYATDGHRDPAVCRPIRRWWARPARWATPRTAVGGAQNLGDLLTTDRAAISVGGQSGTTTPPTSTGTSSKSITR